jgi:hypothetical protein
MIRITGTLAGFARDCNEANAVNQRTMEHSSIREGPGGSPATGRLRLSAPPPPISPSRSHTPTSPQKPLHALLRPRKRRHPGLLGGRDRPSSTGREVRFDLAFLSRFRTLCGLIAVPVPRVCRRVRICAMPGVREAQGGLEEVVMCARLRRLWRTLD